MLPETLSITVSENEESETLHLDGQLDISTAGELEGMVAKVEAPTLVLDLRRLVFIDSSGIRVLLQARREVLAKGRRFRVDGVRGQVRQVVDLAGLRDLLG